ncbi:MAG: TetR family transcriptional regulator [Bacteroidetes bacterium]|jgi:AcrR family transcriptional regulator|nr:TetR family transcriptional regulator [Bacteroidota bacterium]
MTRSRREKIRDITRREIKSTARHLMAEKGTAGLSVRAIAREMDMTASALYHYYASLNDLITALIEDAFTQLADTVEAASRNPALTTSAERLAAVANAYREWALNHPIDFQLLYGNPVPGYSQPTGVTYPPARRSFLVTARIFTEAIERGEIDLPPNYRDLPPALEQSLLDLTQVDGHDLPVPALYLAATAWAKIHGHVMLELFDLIQPVIADVDAFFQHEVRNFAEHVGL